MKERKDLIVIPEQTEWPSEGLYDRAIAALATLDAEALIALQQECESISEITMPLLSFCRRPQESAASMGKKHQLLMKLLVQTRQNLRVLRQVYEVPSTYACFAMGDRTERATWQP
ncbi:MAG: hypothetical protein ACR2JE_13725 [Acidobacteriaceae bacterium]